MSAIIAECCGKSWTAETATKTPAGPHVKASCQICDRYFKFLPQPHEDFVMPIGKKHKGKTMREIWRIDSDYANWILTSDLPPRIKEACHACKPTA